MNLRAIHRLARAAAFAFVAALTAGVVAAQPTTLTTPQAVGTLNYPGAQGETRPALFVSGDRDPLCGVSDLMAFAATAGRNVRAAIVGGDHGFETPSLPRPQADLARRARLESVAALAVGFLTEVQLGAAGAP